MRGEVLQFISDNIDTLTNPNGYDSAVVESIIEGHYIEHAVALLSTLYTNDAEKVLNFLESCALEPTLHFQMLHNDIMRVCASIIHRRRLIPMISKLLKVLVVDFNCRHSKARGDLFRSGILRTIVSSFNHDKAYRKNMGYFIELFISVIKTMDNYINIDRFMWCIEADMFNQATMKSSLILLLRLCESPIESQHLDRRVFNLLKAYKKADPDLKQYYLNALSNIVQNNVSVSMKDTVNIANLTTLALKYDSFHSCFSYVNCFYQIVTTAQKPEIFFHQRYVKSIVLLIGHYNAKVVEKALSIIREVIQDIRFVPFVDAELYDALYRRSRHPKNEKYRALSNEILAKIRSASQYTQSYAEYIYLYQQHVLFNMDLAGDSTLDKDTRTLALESAADLLLKPCAQAILSQSEDFKRMLLALLSSDKVYILSSTMKVCSSLFRDNRQMSETLDAASDEARVIDNLSADDRNESAESFPRSLADKLISILCTSNSTIAMQALDTLNLICYGSDSIKRYIGLHPGLIGAVQIITKRQDVPILERLVNLLNMVTRFDDVQDSFAGTSILAFLVGLIRNPYSALFKKKILSCFWWFCKSQKILPCDKQLIVESLVENIQIIQTTSTDSVSDHVLMGHTLGGLAALLSSSGRQLLQIFMRENVLDKFVELLSTDSKYINPKHFSGEPINFNFNFNSRPMYIRRSGSYSMSVVSIFSMIAKLAFNVEYERTLLSHDFHKISIFFLSVSYSADLILKILQVMLSMMLSRPQTWCELFRRVGATGALLVRLRNSDFNVQALTLLVLCAYMHDNEANVQSVSRCGGRSFFETIIHRSPEPLLADMSSRALNLLDV